MKFITIITPAYNRKDKLVTLYQSLLRQDNKEFVWMIVDDGSSDDTEKRVQEFLEEDAIDILYLKKDNGGKHTALNYGIPRIETPLTIIVDSDDYLLDTAVSTIYSYWIKYKENTSICGFSFLRQHADGKLIVSNDRSEFIDSHVHYRIKLNRPGDMAEVFLTRVLKKYKFPEYDNERFLSEDIVWINIGLKYETVYINKPIYVCEYLQNGLTANDKPLKFASPYGSMLRGKTLLKKECGIKVNIKGAIIYNCYKIEVSGVLPENLLLDNIYEKLLVGFTKIIGRYYNKKWKNFL